MEFCVTLRIGEELLATIRRHGEQAYPEEGAGFLLGHDHGEDREAVRALPHSNQAPADVRARRYRIEAAEVMETEIEAEAGGMEVLGIFHSHPDHPAQPSETDRQEALPWYSYVITSIRSGRAEETRSWRLEEDRKSLQEESLIVEPRRGARENS